ncbi:MAG: glycosyltransferase family 4 protein [Planctomycetes bacterium]|nr:glycosyltransferase family 4 protein [Planctomycetota bacterium]
MAHLGLLVTSAEDPSARFRFGSYLARFRAAGHRAEVLVLPSGRRARARLFRSLRSADAVVLLRRLLQPWETWSLRRAVRRLVFEYDDALLLRDSSRGAVSGAARTWKFAALVRAADQVVAGSAYLARLAQPFRTEVAVVPTVVDPEAYPPRAPHAEAGPEGPVLGWIGTRPNLSYLEALGKPLAALVGERRFTLRVLADAPPALAGLAPARIEFVPWRAEREAEFLRGLDVGLMPLKDDAWCRGKCGLKALQYMAAGVPVVAANVGIAAELIGPAGVTVPPGGDWIAVLRRLLGDAGLRNQLGAEGRRRVQQAFSPGVWFERLEALYLGRADEH